MRNSKKKLPDTHKHILNKGDNSLFLQFQVDEGTLEFEHALLQSLLQMINETQTKDTKTYVNIARAFNDLSDEAIGTDVSRLVGGISIVYMYVLFMLGGFDCVNQKVKRQFG